VRNPYFPGTGIDGCDGSPDRGHPAAQEASRLASIVSQDFWDEQNAGVDFRFDVAALNFRDLFDAHLTPGGSCFEVGCFPGRFLAYLCSRFGYVANGIDATPYVRTRMPEFLRQRGVAFGDFFCEDFLKFNPKQRYDVVCSFGFIEHFSNVEEIIRKHVALVRPGGTLILACPNFRRVQFVFHRVFDAENLRHHVTSSMDLEAWRRILEESGMQIVHEGYYRTAQFWIHPDRPKGLMTSLGGSLVRVADLLDRHLDVPTSWLSPFMISISRKVAGAAHQRPEPS